MMFTVENLLKYIKRLGKQGRIHNPHLLGGGDSTVAGGRRSMQAMASIACTAVRLRRKPSVSGIIRRTCSIQVDAGDMPGMGIHCIYSEDCTYGNCVIWLHSLC